MYIHYNAMSGLIRIPRLYSNVRVSLMAKDSDKVEALYDEAAKYYDDMMEQTF